MAKLGFDPENLPVDSIGSGGAVPKAHLNPEWIKNRFSNTSRVEAGDQCGTGVRPSESLDTRCRACSAGRP